MTAQKKVLKTFVTCCYLKFLVSPVQHLVFKGKCFKLDQSWVSAVVFSLLVVGLSFSVPSCCDTSADSNRWKKTSHMVQFAFTHKWAKLTENVKQFTTAAPFR